MSFRGECRTTPGVPSVGAKPLVLEGLRSHLSPQSRCPGTLPGTGTSPETKLRRSSPAGDCRGLEGPAQTGDENWLDPSQPHGNKDVVCRRVVFMPCVYYKDRFRSS